MSAADLARLSGVDKSKISRYRKGAKGGQEWVSPKDFEALAVALSDNPAEHAELLLARLLDERRGPGADRIQITIRGQMDVPANEPKPHIKLSDDAERRFDVIRDAYVKDKDVRCIVDGLGDLLLTPASSHQTVNYPAMKTPPVRPLRVGSAKRKIPHQL